MGGGRQPPAKKASKASAAKQAAASTPPDDTDAVTQELAEQLRSLMAHMGGASRGTVLTQACNAEAAPCAGGAPGGRAGSSGDAPEEDILTTIAALERQTRFSTGGSEETSAAGPSGAFPPQMDEAAHQAMLAQARSTSPAARLRSLTPRGPPQFEQMGADSAVASLLDTMMAQLSWGSAGGFFFFLLLSKDVLYEPLQQISARVRASRPPSAASVCTG